MLGALSVLQLVLKHRGDLRPARPRRLDTDDFAIVVANAEAAPTSTAASLPPVLAKLAPVSNIGFSNRPTQASTAYHEIEEKDEKCLKFDRKHRTKRRERTKRSATQ